MSWWSRWRQDPIPPGADLAPTAQASAAEQIAPAPDPWRPLAGEFALRLLTLTWEAVHHVGQAEQAEHDPQRRALLFRIDHTITRTRRLAENLRVLTGEAVDDPDPQTITLQDIARAAGASAEHYERLRFGPIVDLAVTADAADDVIRILTELIDNADRYSPPELPVSVAGHLTGDGEVLLRVEDAGIGIPPDRLHAINGLLADEDEPRDADLQPSRVGLPVVAVLTRRHPSLRVWLSPRTAGGTVAMLRIGVDLLCEVPQGALPASTAPSARPQHAPPAAPRPRPGLDSDSTAILPITGTAPPMPRRVPASIRVAEPAPAAPVASYTTLWHDDAEAFNAGVDAARHDRLAPSRKGPGA